MPNLVGRSRGTERPWRGLVIVSGDGGRGSATRCCLACPRCCGEALSERGGPGVLRGDEATRALRVSVGAPMPSSAWFWASWARACLVFVVLSSTNGEYQHAQGTKGRLWGMVARDGEERREREQGTW